MSEVSHWMLFIYSVCLTLYNSYSMVSRIKLMVNRSPHQHQSKAKVLFEALNADSRSLVQLRLPCCQKFYVGTILL